MKRIGVRELRQNASVHLRLVQAGETIEITDRGRPIALLVPLEQESGQVHALSRQGRLTPDLGDLLDLGTPVTPLSEEATPSQQLELMRAVER